MNGPDPAARGRPWPGDQPTGASDSSAGAQAGPNAGPSTGPTHDDLSSAATQPTRASERTAAAPVWSEADASDRSDGPADPAGPGSAPARPRTPGRRWLAWLLVFLGLFVAGSAWALATPEYGSPDEPSHVYRAAGAVRGQIVPAELDTHTGGTGIVYIPRAFKEAAEQAGRSGETDSPGQTPCYAHDVMVTADCFEAVEDDRTLVRAGTGAGRYNPAYYALVGAPSLVWPGSVGLYAMRILSAAFCSALLASAILSAMWGRGGRLVTIGVLAGVTPTVLFLTGTVNPNGLEIAAAASLWVALLRLVTGTGEHIPTLLRRAGIAGALLVVSRGLSPLWLAVIALTCLLVARRDVVLPLLRRAGTWLWGGLVALATAGAVAWLGLYGMTEVPVKRPNDVSYFGAIGLELKQLGNRLVQHVGVFGWNDTFPPPAVTFGWTLLLGAVIGAAVAVIRARAALVLGGLFLVSVIGPFFIEATQYDRLELFWQSRYSLPIAIGVPILAAIAVATRDGPLAADRTDRIDHRLEARRPLVLALVVVVSAHVACFLHVLIRYQSGLTGGWNPLTGSWHPPVGSVTVIAIFGAGILLLALTVLALRPGTEERPADGIPPGPDRLDDLWSVEEPEGRVPERTEYAPVHGAARP